MRMTILKRKNPVIEYLIVIMARLFMIVTIIALISYCVDALSMERSAIYDSTENGYSMVRANNICISLWRYDKSLIDNLSGICIRYLRTKNILELTRDNRTISDEEYNDLLFMHYRLGQFVNSVFYEMVGI